MGRLPVQDSKRSSELITELIRALSQQLIMFIHNVCLVITVSLGGGGGRGHAQFHIPDVKSDVFAA